MHSIHAFSFECFTWRTDCDRISLMKTCHVVLFYTVGLCTCNDTEQVNTNEEYLILTNSKEKNKTKTNRKKLLLIDWWMQPFKPVFGMSHRDSIFPLLRAQYRQACNTCTLSS